MTQCSRNRQLFYWSHSLDAFWVRFPNQKSKSEEAFLSFPHKIRIISSSGAPSQELTKLEHPSGRIIDGYKVNITDVPWQVSLQRNGISHFCGGAIIGSRWILTAAHCLYSQSVGGTKVRVGATRAYNDGHLISAKKLIVHEKYNTKASYMYDYDFGLIELATELEFSEKVSPIGLPAANRTDAPGTIVSVNGWGITEFGAISQDLLGVKLPLVDQAKCKKAYNFLNAVTLRMICAGYEEGGKNSKFQNTRFFTFMILNR